MREGGLVEVELINFWLGLAERLRIWEEEPICEVVRHVVNFERWGLDHVVEQDTPV